ncbi:spermidine/putrescine ABC transporter substrate-binding protein [Floricoccus penangensis]|uniref:Spermidine/putrescine ABC transporter substrate-binding protein n=1 Tax=Floricoccus penangensis TaxID=1859475 RepID=A0A9Q5JH00_9LACT|nr:ABC transporter substrate-binding protein [Floricoccus penangensis]OFI46816.1 spermidine/putrescine ABC transporter substrate-binding protein [Floricoccus penangensis]
MKKLLSFFGGIIIIMIVLIICSSSLQRKSGGKTAANTLTIYNWGDYIDPELLKDFETKTGYKVNYETYDSNEAMYTKIQQGGTSYDIAIPSEYMIEKLISENLIEKLDHSKIKGLNNIEPQFLNLDFDKNNQYSIPYFWGTLGIVYNDKLVEKVPSHWSDLWDKKYANNLMLVDGAREVIGMGLNTLGYSLNSTDINQIDEATVHLKDLTPNVKAIVADEIKQYMISDEAAVAMTFSGAAASMLEENDHLHYVVPTEGSNLWFDNMVMPKTVGNKKAAYEFINFMLEPENAKKNAEYVGYATPNAKAKELLPDDVKNDKQFYPEADTMKNLEVYKDLGKEWLGIYNDKYLQFKMYRK